MSAEAYPLQWPTGRKRTGQYARDNGKFDVSFSRARDNIIREVGLLVGRYNEPRLVISTNVALRRDGFPLASQRTPDDTGVAVYFTHRKRQMAFACDRWVRIEHNMQAIAKTIEALRGIDRWGTGDMVEAAFTGFAALPAPSSPNWWDVLECEQHASAGTIRTQFRRLASIHHPDKGGSAEKMAQINAAYAKALGQ